MTPGFGEAAEYRQKVPPPRQQLFWCEIPPSLSADPRSRHGIIQHPLEDDMAVSTSAATAFRIFETDLGWTGFQGTPLGMTALTFGHASEDEVYERLDLQSMWTEDEILSAAAAVPERIDPADSPPTEPAWMGRAEQLLQAYAAGEPVELESIPCDLPPGTRFEERVRQQLSRVRYGQTITYGQLAEAAGAPRAARAVGSVMARNPIPLVIACHRVVASSGKLGGYSAPAGLTMKERLLQIEQSGISHVVSNG